ncbi:MAG: LysR family transcriptional regulator [Cohaesibacteraceae bacterium]|nr:LysR family transcriptional regulator [Cohaesibacteraceae bacterium]MBL4876854.1 LysR family transcriptional regulator [Cohaesibacteraceae bacterium]
MTLEQLRTFLWVARLGGIRRAAQEMNISQPAVSARIASLEEMLGVSLFIRAQRGVSLTKQGVMLRDHAEKIADIVERIKAEIMPPEAVNQLLRIGVSESIVQLWLSKILAELYGNYPNIKIEVSVDITTNLRQQLLDRSLDLAILMGPVSEYNIDNIDLPLVELSWYCAAGNEVPDLSTTPVVSYNRNSRPYREVRKALLDRYGPTTQVFSSSSISAGLEMVGSGIAVGMFPTLVGEEMVQRGKIVEFDPGWKLTPLQFTASYIGDPRNEICVQAARIAVEVARNHEAG